MKYPNLVFAIAKRRFAHYEIAVAVGMSEWRFSRCLNGRSSFAPHEKTRIAEALNYDIAWLFESVIPRPTRADEQTRGRLARAGA